MSEAQTRKARIREAKIGDSGELARLATQLGYPNSADEVASRMGRYGGQAEAVVFVAEEGTEQETRLLGWTSAEIVDHFYTPRCVEISGLIVDEAARGGGLGAMLLASAEAWARGKGVSILRLRANVVRTRAHRFYLREGFEIKKTQHVFEKRL
ncbi:MAG TPA: GNAT family N-acetyltransferase [Rectinemataceae bacterium]